DFAYKNGTSVATGTLVAGDPSPIGSALRIGADNSAGANNGQLIGDIAELLVYNAVVNSAQQIITENYLSSKYNVAVASDRYDGDTPGHFNFDFDAFGVGRTDGGANGGSVSTGSSGAVSLQITSGLDDGDYLMAGFQTNNNSAQSLFYLD